MSTTWEDLLYSSGTPKTPGVNYFDDHRPDPAEALYDSRGLRNSDRITDQLVVGGDEYLYAWDELRKLEALGVTHVLDCRTTWEAESTNKFERRTHPESVFECGSNPTDDDGVPKTARYWEKGIAWAVDALETPGAVLYVHCAMGINRGPSNALAILTMVHGMSVQDAMILIRTSRPQAAMAYWRDIAKLVKSRA